MSIGQHIRYLMENDRRDNIHILQDKILLKDELLKLGISEFVNTEYISREAVDITKLSNLPNKYIIKVNHGCGWNIFYKNGEYKMLAVSDFINPSNRYVQKIIQPHEIQPIL